MLVKKNKLNNVVRAFGQSGVISTVTYLQKFRSFSVYNTAGTCTVTTGGNVITIPVGVTITWDAPIEESVINRYDSGTFIVNAQDGIVAATY